MQRFVSVPIRNMILILFGFIAPVVSGGCSPNTQTVAPQSYQVQGTIVGPVFTSSSDATSQRVANAEVSAVDYMTGKMLDSHSTTDDQGRFTLTLPKGKNVLIVATATLSGFPVRLSNMIPDVEGPVQVQIDAATSMAAEAWAERMGNGARVTQRDLDKTLIAASTALAKRHYLDPSDLKVGGLLFMPKLGDGLNRHSPMAQTVEETLPGMDLAVDATRSILTLMNTAMPIAHQRLWSAATDAPLQAMLAGLFPRGALIGSLLRYAQNDPGAFPLNQPTPVECNRFADSEFSIPSSVIALNDLVCRATGSPAVVFSVTRTSRPDEPPFAFRFTSVEDPSLEYDVTVTDSLPAPCDADSMHMCRSQYQVHLQLRDHIFSSPLTFDGALSTSYGTTVGFRGHISSAVFAGDMDAGGNHIWEGMIDSKWVELVHFLENGDLTLPSGTHYHGTLEGKGVYQHDLSDPASVRLWLFDSDFSGRVTFPDGSWADGRYSAQAFDPAMPLAGVKPPPNETYRIYSDMNEGAPGIEPWRATIVSFSHESNTIQDRVTLQRGNSGFSTVWTTTYTDSGWWSGQPLSTTVALGSDSVHFTIQHSPGNLKGITGTITDTTGAEVGHLSMDGGTPTWRLRDGSQLVTPWLLDDANKWQDGGS